MQNRRQFMRRMGSWSAWMGYTSLCLLPLPAHADKTPAAVSLTCSESFRQETLTRSYGFNGSETISAYGGKLNINAEMPCSQKAFAALTGDAPVVVSVGNYTFHAALGDDLNFWPGQTSARLTTMLSSASGNTRTLVATVQVRWSKEKISVKVEAKLPQAGKPIAAQDFVTAHAGNLKAETSASLQVGDITAELTVPLQGRVQRESASNGDQSGEVVVIELHGKGVKKQNTQSDGTP